MDAVLQIPLEQFIGLQWLNTMTRYFLVAGLAYMVFWRWCFGKFQSRFLYSEMPKTEDLKREVKYSIMTSFIFLIPTILIYSVKDSGITKIYWNIGEHSVGWYLASYLVVFFLHDTYFYWNHRLMHHKRLYKYFHNIHHLSKKPTPLAAFAFHPLEAIVEAMIFPLISLVMPVHFSVLVIFSLFSLFMNVYGHLGFSLFSEKQLNSFPLKMFSHSTHHSWHHQFYKGNYGFYLQFWDRLMGTWKGGLRK